MRFKWWGVEAGASAAWNGAQAAAPVVKDAASNAANAVMSGAQAAAPMVGDAASQVASGLGDAASNLGGPVVHALPLRAGGDGGCFPAGATVWERHRGRLSMEDVRRRALF